MPKKHATTAHATVEVAQLLAAINSRREASRLRRAEQLEEQEIGWLVLDAVVDAVDRPAAANVHAERGGQVVAWSEEASHLHIVAVLAAMDQAVDELLRRLRKSALEVLTCATQPAAQMPTSAPMFQLQVGLNLTTHAAAAHEPSGFQLHVGIASLVHKRVEAWRELRQIRLTETTYEAWLKVLDLSLQMHAVVVQLKACGDGLGGESIAASIGGLPVTEVVSRLVAKLLLGGVLTPELAAAAAKATQEQRQALELFNLESQKAELDSLLRLAPSAMQYLGPHFTPQHAAWPRRFLLAATSSPRKGAGTEATEGAGTGVAEYRAGVHYKRHTEKVGAEKLAAAYRLALGQLQIACPATISLPVGQVESWRKFMLHLEDLRDGLDDAQHILSLLYSNVYKNMRSPSSEDAGPTIDYSDDPRPELSDQEWLRAPSIYFRGDDPTIRLVRPSLTGQLSLDRLQFSERRMYCAVCHRTKVSAHHCYRHEQSGRAIMLETKSSAGMRPLVERLLHAQRHARLVELVQAKLNDPGQNYLSPARASLGTKPIPLQDSIYLGFKFTPPHLMSAEAVTDSSIEALHALYQPAERSCDPWDWGEDWNAFNALKEVCLMQSAHSLYQDPAVRAERWIVTTAALRQGYALFRDVTRLIEHLRLPKDIALAHGVSTQPGPELLRGALNGYLLQLEKILFRSSRGSDLPVVPSSLYRHFFGLWFSGGVWPAAENYPWRVAEHDASPQLLSEIENDTVPLDPVCVVQQIERWSAWLSLQACETKVSRPRYNRIGEVLALKSQGLSAKSIALELGVSHQTVRAALMRHRQRVDATAEPADNATIG